MPRGEDAGDEAGAEEEDEEEGEDEEGEASFWATWGIVRDLSSSFFASGAALASFTALYPWLCAWRGAILDGVAFALGALDVTAGGILVDDVLAEAQHRVVHRHVDELAAAAALRRQQRRDKAERCECSRKQVADARPGGNGSTPPPRATRSVPVAGPAGSLAAAGS